jgi:hypothetical protein
VTTELKPIGQAGDDVTSPSAIGQRLRIVAAQRAEEVLGELPKLVRRVGTLLLVLSISIPVFVVVLIAILWYLAS